MAGKRKKNTNEEEPNTSAWMVTFSDLIMLLLTFFVLLLTMSSMDTKKLKETFANFSGAPGVLELSGSRGIGDLASFITRYESSDRLVVINQDYIRRLLIPSFKKSKKVEKVIADLSKLIHVSDDHRGLVLSFQNHVLFDPGSVTLRKDAYPFLDAIANAISSCPNDILIMGHTDDRPIQTGRFASNWELSAYRGISVLRYFLEKKDLPPSRFSVGGYGPSRPVHKNDSERNRALNRRVEIIFRHLKEV